MDSRIDSLSCRPPTSHRLGPTRFSGPSNLWQAIHPASFTSSSPLLPAHALPPSAGVAWPLAAAFCANDFLGQGTLCSCRPKRNITTLCSSSSLRLKLGMTTTAGAACSPLLPSVPSFQAGQVIDQIVEDSRIFTNIIVKSTTRQCRFHDPFRESLHHCFIGVKKLRAEVRFVLALPNIIEARAKNWSGRIKTVTIAAGVFLD